MRILRSVVQDQSSGRRHACFADLRALDRLQLAFQRGDALLELADFFLQFSSCTGWAWALARSYCVRELEVSLAGRLTEAKPVATPRPNCPQA